MITEADAYLFAQGTHYEIYEKMGAHEAEIDGQKGVYFAVWAPNAKYVNVIGSFNNWDIFQDNMDRISEEVFLHYLFRVQRLGICINM